MVVAAGWYGVGPILDCTHDGNIARGQDLGDSVHRLTFQVAIKNGAVEGLTASCLDRL
jgi:hypothetical protein